jgi:hypothetical protein
LAAKAGLDSVPIAAVARMNFMAVLLKVSSL